MTFHKNIIHVQVYHSRTWSVRCDGADMMLFTLCSVFEPTCAYCTVVSYVSLSVCPSVYHWIIIHSKWGEYWGRGLGLITNVKLLFLPWVVMYNASHLFHCSTGMLLVNEAWGWQQQSQRLGYLKLGTEADELCVNGIQWELFENKDTWRSTWLLQDFVTL